MGGKEGTNSCDKVRQGENPLCPPSIPLKKKAEAPTRGAVSKKDAKESKFLNERLRRARKE